MKYGLDEENHGETCGGDAAGAPAAGAAGREEYPALIRELVEREQEKGETVYAMTADLAGSLARSAKDTTNMRKRFRC